MKLNKGIFEILTFLTLIVGSVNIFTFYRGNKESYIKLYERVRKNRIVTVIDENDPYSDIKVFADEFNNKKTEGASMYLVMEDYLLRIHVAYSFFPTVPIEIERSVLENSDTCSTVKQGDVIVASSRLSLNEVCFEVVQYSNFITYSRK